MRKDSEIQRRVTDRKGRFAFEDLRPGTWTFTVYNGMLPEHHYYEKDTFTFELEPDDREEIVVKVLPRIRPIRMLEENGVVLEEKKQ